MSKPVFLVYNQLGTVIGIVTVSHPEYPASQFSNDWEKAEALAEVSNDADDYVRETTNTTRIILEMRKLGWVVEQNPWLGYVTLPERADG